MVPPFNWERSRDGKIAPCQQLHRRSIKAATFTTRRFPSKVQARRAVCTCMLPLTGGIPSYWKHQRERELWQTTVTPSRLCQVLCPPKRQMGTFEYSQPHATITAKLFCFSGNVDNRTVVF